MWIAPNAIRGNNNKQMSNNPEGVKRKIVFNPFGVVKRPYIFLSELHSELFTFNPFGIVNSLFKSQLGIIIEPYFI